MSKLVNNKKINKFHYNNDHGIIIKKNIDWKFNHIVDNVLSNSECDGLLNNFHSDTSLNSNNLDEKHELTQEQIKGISNKDDLDPEGKITWRKSNLRWIQYYHINYEWLFDRLIPLFREANDRIFKYDIPSSIPIEPLQFTHYPKNGRYRSHTDWNGLSPQHQTRKLSFSLQLSNPDSYEGGNLEFDIPRTPDINDEVWQSQLLASKKRGSMTIFPSFLKHRATEVTKGDRFALIGWIHGNVFR